MTDEQYERQTLLKIKRELSEDEKFKFVLNQLSKAHKKNGEDAAYIAELEDKVKELEGKKPKLTKADIDAKTLQLVNNLESRITKHEQTISTLRKNNSELATKLTNLKKDQ